MRGKRDDVVRLTGYYTKQKNPDELRIVGYVDKETGEYYEYFTNNFELASKTIADIYKSLQLAAATDTIEVTIKVELQ